MKECSMFTQIPSNWFTFVRVCPGAKCVKVSVVEKHSPTLSGRKTPPPRFASGSSFQVVGVTDPVRQSSSAEQPLVPAIPVKVGCVPTSVSRSTRLVLAQPLSSSRYSCAVYAPGWA